MNKYNKETHVEISDGDTLIVSICGCPLESPESVDLVVNNTICCVNGVNICSHFYKYLDGSKGTMVQCSKLDTSKKDVPDFTKLVKENVTSEFRVKLNNINEDGVNLIEVIENGKVVDILDPMKLKNSGIAWGYSGGGPETLAIILAEKCFGDYTVEEFDIVMGYVKNYDKNSDFFTTYIELDNLVNGKWKNS